MILGWVVSFTTADLDLHLSAGPHPASPVFENQNGGGDVAQNCCAQEMLDCPCRATQWVAPTGMIWVRATQWVAPTGEMLAGRCVAPACGGEKKHKLA